MKLSTDLVWLVFTAVLHQCYARGVCNSPFKCFNMDFNSEMRSKWTELRSYLDIYILVPVPEHPSDGHSDFDGP